MKLRRVLATILLALSLLPLSPSLATAAPVINGAVFNDPTATSAGGPTAKQSAVMDQLIGLIQAVPAGGEIRFVWFEFKTGAKSTPVANELVAAVNRGVHVQVVLDGKSSQVLAMLRTGFDAAGDPGSRAVGCPAGRGCIARNYNHNKFALFSKVRVNGVDHGNVVFQTSSNLTDWYLYNSYNDAYTLSDAKVYADYRKYFTDLRAMNQNPDYFWAGGSGTTYKGHFYPREQAAGKDPVENILKLVECSYTDEGGTRRQTDVRIVMTHWTPHRVRIAQQLRALRDQGCWIDIVYPATRPGTSDHWVDPPILQALAPLGSGPGRIQVTACRFQVAGNDVVPHAKVMLLDGFYDNDITPRVYTGSANFTHLENSDDAWLRIMGRATHTTYLTWFYKVRKDCGYTG